MYNTFKTIYYYGLSYLESASFRELDIYVTSHGGVGTTFLLEYLSKFKVVNEPYDMKKSMVKHLPVPPLRAPKDLRVIYIFGDPVLATLSLYKRSFAHFQACKNGSFLSISKNSDINYYLEKHQDRLGLTNHLKNWMENIAQPTLFINYDALWKHKEVIASFVGLPDSCFRDFPLRKKRNSRFSELTAKQIEAFEDIYSEYYKIMNEIGDFKQINT